MSLHLQLEPSLNGKYYFLLIPFLPFTLFSLPPVRLFYPFIPLHSQFRYDFFVFGSLATTLADQFYNTGSESGNVIAWLATYAVGFIVRPFGALLFGLIGDTFGRKFTFLLTLIVMGVCSSLVGILPTISGTGTYHWVGDGPGVLLIILRIIQGLAIGGEYGGASVVRGRVLTFSMSLNIVLTSIVDFTLLSSKLLLLSV